VKSEEEGLYERSCSRVQSYGMLRLSGNLQRVKTNLSARRTDVTNEKTERGKVDENERDNGSRKGRRSGYACIVAYTGSTSGS